MPSKNFALTPEQIALSQERKRKKAETALAAAAAVATQSGTERPPSFLSRAFLSKPTSCTRDSSCQVTIMSWNMLAQCLVRRELFPTSDCLKAAQREGMLIDEIINSEADVVCLQEVDRLEKLSPALESAGYHFAYAAGPRKKHGCVIAFKKDVYEKVNERVVLYDDTAVRQETSEEATEQARRGASFRTRNIGLLIALRRIGSGNNRDEASVVVATTHLFWHPKYTYERARQAFILTRSLCLFKQEAGLRNAPAFIAGDFNFNPSDAAYALLVGDALTVDQENDILASHVVHVSLDPSVPVDPTKTSTDNDEDEEAGAGEDDENDPDRVIKNARKATPADGLLQPQELIELFANLPPLRSAYDKWEGMDEKRTFGSRTVVPVGRRGRNDPLFTSYTHYWKSTLDYIFMICDEGHKYDVERLLEPALPEQLGSGLPRKGICGSDHLSLRAKISWTSDVKA